MHIQSSESHVRVGPTKLTCIVEEWQEGHTGSDLSDDSLNLGCDFLV